MQSICPTVHGREDIKRGIALQVLHRCSHRRPFAADTFLCDLELEVVLTTLRRCSEALER
jgi:hypothetical protein